MGLLNSLFSGNVSNPTLAAAIEKYQSDASDDNLVDLWQKFLKSRVILAVPAEAAKGFAKIKNIREAVNLPCQTMSRDSGDSMLVVYTDTSWFNASLSESPSITVTGEQAYQLAAGKGLFGLTLNPKTAFTCELKVWQHQIFIEKLGDANKLHALAAKLIRAGNTSDAEAVMKAALVAAQKDGQNHPYCAELNVELSRLQRAQGKLAEAEWTLKRALSIYEQLGRRELDAANTAEELGSMLCESGKPELGATFLHKALDLYNQVPGGKADSVARVLLNLAETPGTTAAEAEQLYTRACVQLEERKHADLVGALVKLGRIVEQSGRYNEALAHYMRAVNTFESLKKARSIDFANAARAAASLHLNLGHVSEARSLAERAQVHFRKEGTNADLQAIEGLLVTISHAETQPEPLPVVPARGEPFEDPRLETSAERRAAGQKPQYSRAKNPATELPFLDSVMSIKQKSPAQEPKKEEKPSDPEEEALQQMRAFLDSLGKTESAAAGGKSEQIAAQAVASNNAEEPQVQESIASDQSAAVVTEETQPAASQQPDLSIPETTPAENNDTQPQATPPSAEAADVMNTVLAAIGVEPAKSGGITASSAAVPPAAAPKVIPPPPAVTRPADAAAPVATPPHPLAAPPPPAPQPTAPAAPPGQSQSAPPPPAPQQASAHTPESAPSEVDATTSVAATSPSHSMSGGEQLGHILASEISSVFSRSVLGDLNRHERFDKPISERLKELSQSGKLKVSAEKLKPLTPRSSVQEVQAPPAPPPPPPAAPPSPAAQPAPPVTPPPVTPPPATQPTESATEALPPATASQATQPTQSVTEAPPAAPPSQPQPAKPIPPPDNLEGTIIIRNDYEDIRAMAMLGQLKQRISSAKMQLSKIADEKPPAAVPPRATPAPAPAATPTPAAAPEHSPAERSAREMLDALDAKLKQDPNNAELLLRKGTVLAKLDRIDDAIKVFDKLTMLQPNDPQGWYCKGSSLYLKNNFEDALYCFNHVLNLDGGHRKAMLRKAECLLKLGRSDQAIVLFERLLAVDPTFVAGWLSKARALLNQGRLADALSCYRQVLQLEPDNETAKKAKALIESKMASGA